MAILVIHFLTKKFKPTQFRVLADGTNVKHTHIQTFSKTNY